MNKTKKKILKLEDYLGRDAQGKNLLEDISRDVTEQRQELNRTNEFIERLTNQNQIVANERNQCMNELEARDGLVKSLKVKTEILEKEVVRLQQENAKANALLAAYESDFDSPERDVMAKAHGLHIPKDSEYQIDIKEFTCMFNTLKKEMRFCPKAISHERVGLTFELFDIVKGFDALEMAKLGRFVACNAVLPTYRKDSPPNVTTAHPLTRNVKDRKVLSDKVLAKYVHWFRQNIRISPTEDKIFDATKHYDESRGGKYFSH